ncbi:MAG: Clp protease ClpP [Gemmatimonas sp.]|nr:Clp protease ClpP [Gemmatimonas sp.]
MHFRDQLSNLKGEQLDLILQTPGGSGEVAQDMVRIIRKKFSRFCVLVPGWAKSAGTIIAMGADEIVMSDESALGPIDAQIARNGNVFSADAFIKGFEKIKAEVATGAPLNKAYIPMLQGISPGDLENAENALGFAKVLVQEWLTNYKFASWNIHRSTGEPVTRTEKEAKALEIANALCAQSERWKRHGRSLMIKDLEDLGLRITNVAENSELDDAFRRYYALQHLTFERTAIYKIFETPDSFVFRSATPAGPGAAPFTSQRDGIPRAANIGVICGRCGSNFSVQANFDPNEPLKAGCIPFPENNAVDCPSCGFRTDLTAIRNNLEAQCKKAIVIAAKGA